MARVSRQGAYDLRNRADGRAFALAWEAAILMARGRVADEALSRSMCGVIERVYRDGELVAERHRYDNRLTMAVLTRLDRLAEAQCQTAAPARVIAGEWDQFLDIVEAGGDGAGDFLEARAALIRSPLMGEGRVGVNASTAAAFPNKSEPRPPLTPTQPPPSRGRSAEEIHSTTTQLARLENYRTFGAGLPQEIDVSALDPAAMADWTDAQWRRAEASGLLDRLPAADWPDCAKTSSAANPSPLMGEGRVGVSASTASTSPDSHEPHPPLTPTHLPHQRGGENTDGMCKVRQAYALRNPPKPEPEDDYAGRRVWDDADGEWRTDFPPPAGFDGWEQGDPDDAGYRRALTDAERAALAPDLAEIAAEWDADRAAAHAARDRFFGFAATAAGESP